VRLFGRGPPAQLPRPKQRKSKTHGAAATATPRAALRTSMFPNRRPRLQHFRLSDRRHPHLGVAAVLRHSLFAFWPSHVPESAFGRFWQMLRSALADGGRVLFADDQPAATALDTYVAGSTEVVERRLRNGTCHRAHQGRPRPRKSHRPAHRTRLASDHHPVRRLAGRPGTPGAPAAAQPYHVHGVHHPPGRTTNRQPPHRSPRTACRTAPYTPGPGRTG
jgi:hypothetical protein